MPNFSYKALGRDGKEVRGVLQAESEAAAASRIRENYPILLSISQKKEKSDVLVKIYTEQIGKSKAYIEKMAKISWDRCVFFV